MTTIRKGQAPPRLDRLAFGERFRQSFEDPAFAGAAEAVARLEEIAWDAYRAGRKAPRTRTAGVGYADPHYELSVDWLADRARVHAALARQRNPHARTR